MDPSELLSTLEEEIVKAKGEVASRKDIMILLEKWMLACEEEGWLEDYNKVLGSHLLEVVNTCTVQQYRRRILSEKVERFPS